MSDDVRLDPTTLEWMARLIEEHLTIPPGVDAPTYLRTIWQGAVRTIVVATRDRAEQERARSTSLADLVRACEVAWSGALIDMTAFPHGLSTRTGERHGFAAFHVRVRFHGHLAVVDYFADLTGVTDGEEVARAAALHRTVQCKTARELQAILETLGREVRP